MSKLLSMILGGRTDFEKIFFINEYKALAGKNNRSILALLAILFLTFLALGFALGSLNNLRQKMDNPFTNWVDLEVNNYISNKSTKIVERYNDPEIAEGLQLNSTNGFVRFNMEFYQAKHDIFKPSQDALTKNYWGRAIDTEDPLFFTILESRLNGANDSTQEISLGACDIIVTKYMLESLGFEDPGAVQYLCLNNNGDPLFLRVAAVVEELPSLCRFAASPQFYNLLYSATASDNGVKCLKKIADNKQGGNSLMFLTDNEANLAAIEQAADQFFGRELDATANLETEYTLNGKKHLGCKLSFSPSDLPAYDSLKLFVRHANQTTPCAEYALVDCDETACQSLDEREAGYLAFNFGELEKIRAFRQDMYDNFGVEIDMNQVEEKENFSLVSKLTLAISIILLLFGILSIVMFVINLLRTHLFKVRSNLGTFQAFGLSNRFLIQGYLKIIFSFLALSIFVAFLLAAGVDIIEKAVNNDESKFDIFHPLILAAAIVLVSISLLLSARTIWRILGDTPGNLIYER